MPTLNLRGKPKAVHVVAVVAAFLAVLVVVGVAVALVSTSTPEFFSRYHLLERRYVNLGNSAHEDIGCRTCHETNVVKNGAQLVGDFYRSMVETTATPVYFSFGAPTNDACLQCHETNWSHEESQTARIPHPAHLSVAAETRQCTSCHKWTAHREAYLDKHKEMPFSGVCVAYGCHVGTKDTEQCFNCHHVLHEANETWRTEHPAVIKVAGANSCVESCHTTAQCQQCHTTGVRPEFQGQKIETSMRAIEALHVRDDWTGSPHGDEALKDRSKCLLCHETEGECQECHLERPAFHEGTDTWIGRHVKVAVAVDDPRCIECHEQRYCDDCHDQFKEME